ncbi:hypothetical protein LUZ60_017576 [Juncus effusus]|nr:hypothetical protein LUZ60_017576 [Juncus effusus]
MEKSDVNIQLGRKTSNYDPTAWGDFFITYNSPNHMISKEQLSIRTKEVKERLIKMILSKTDTCEVINLIDTVEHLGIGYHFEKEINCVMQNIDISKFESDALHDVALRFRILRQHGFHVSADEFLKFKDQNGNFKAKLGEDVRGLLSLYNAAHLMVHGEGILEEAISFTREHLSRNVGILKSSLRSQVLRALKSPLPRMMKRLEARFYIEEYEEEEFKNDLVLEFAKLDFNLVQSLHCEELKAITLWWNELNLKETLSYSRDRITECYFWILGIYFEPHFSRARIISTKVISLLSILDDTFDIYGTLEECRLLTNAIQRWDERATEMIPDYLKDYYLKILNTAEEVESELQPSKKYRISYFKESFKIMAEAYLQEAEWYARDYVPNVDERKEHSIISSGYPVMCCIAFVGMEEVATKEAFEWASSIPKVIRASAEVARFTDDILGYEREHKLGQVASTFDCYMKQYNATKEETTIRFYSWIEDAWMTMNQECLKPTVVSQTLTEIVVNFARMMQVVYTHSEDGYNKCENLKEFITLVLLNPFHF